MAQVESIKKNTSQQKAADRLRLQLYGKDKPLTVKNRNTVVTTSGNKSTSVITHESDKKYLTRDLAKTVILATLAVAAQIAIYIGIQNGIIKF
jgi:hypothetical protein